MSRTDNLIELCAKEAIGDGEVIKVEAHGLELAVYNVGGTYFVTNDLCTHGPGSLSEGFLEGHVIECDFHQGQFDIRTGEVVGPPCIENLKTYDVIPHDSSVVIAAPED